MILFLVEINPIIQMEDMKSKMEKAERVAGEITSHREQDAVSLIDIAKDLEKPEAINEWMKYDRTVRFLAYWEKTYNPNFKEEVGESLKTQADSETFEITPKEWVDATNAIGITFKGEDYEDPFAHKDIALQFAMWASPFVAIHVNKYVADGWKKQALEKATGVKIYPN